MSESHNKADAGAERVEVMTSPLAPGARWQPNVGEETERLLERLEDLDEASKRTVRDEAVAVLARCMPPGPAGSQTTGLVLGQVQSGKTMSFTTVAALARDNNYRMVIVITGTTVALLNQSDGRLRKDLGLERDHHSWKHVAVTPQAQINRDAISNVLDEWRDDNVDPHERRTLLITVMKQHQNLQRLIAVLRTLDLSDVPTLVIDDEGDQASLNIKVKSRDESTTYRRLVALKRCLPQHTFLQYTATPQALLLINIIDVLSPVFAEILAPGAEYTGGRAFFLDNAHLVRDIPPQEVPTKQSPLTQPPDSLFEAMRLFLLGVAAGMGTRDGGKRSMMVHPSYTTAEHQQFHHWVLTAKEDWKRILGLPAGDQDRVELLEEFRASYADLQATVPCLPVFDVLADRLVQAIRNTHVEELNRRGGSTPSVDWSDSYAFILIGGLVMDRGFTVRGLTVTYMPRGLGMGHADTVQQRGRFFGYKRRYLGYCRVFLEGDVLSAFRDYVEHEEDVRARLERHRDSGRPLSEWRRQFLLDIAMKPTRGLVLDIPYQQLRIGGDWFVPRAPHESEEAVAANRELVSRLKGQLQFVPDSGHPDRTEFQKHLVCDGLRLDLLYDALLSSFSFTHFQDSQEYVSLLLIIRKALAANPEELGAVYLMSRWEARERTLNDREEIPTLFQGEAPVMPKSKRGTVYPGDAAIRSDSRVTVQIHNVTVAFQGGRKIADVPTLAVWIPPSMSRDVVVQPQGRQA